MLDAPQRAREAKLTLTDKLRRAAAELPCKCGGVWAEGAKQILANNSVDAAKFAQAVLRALRVGARRGCNVACVGVGGCGKSALLEPLEQVFRCAPKPQAGSTFPLASALNCDVLLWQDYSHHEATLSFTDLLAFVVGEGLDVRLPGKNVKLHNKAPVFFSGRTGIRSKVSDADAAYELNRMMSERFTTFKFAEPLPLASRKADWVHCGKCAAQFYLQFDGIAALEEDDAEAVPAPPPAPASAREFVAELRELASLKEAGHLDDTEFVAAKRRLLQLK